MKVLIIFSTLIVAALACKDTRSDCSRLTKYCRLSPAWASRECQKTCRLCPSDCHDRSPNCHTLTHLCNSNKYVIDNCKTTCGRCNPTTTQIPGTTNGPSN